MIFAQPLGTSTSDRQFEHAVGKTFIQPDRPIVRRDLAQALSIQSQFFQLAGHAWVTFEQLFDSRDFIATEGIIQIPTEHLIDEFLRQCHFINQGSRGSSCDGMCKPVSIGNGCRPQGRPHLRGNRHMIAGPRVRSLVITPFGMPGTA